MYRHINIYINNLELLCISSKVVVLREREWRRAGLLFHASICHLDRCIAQTVLGLQLKRRPRVHLAVTHANVTVRNQAIDRAPATTTTFHLIWVTYRVIVIVLNLPITLSSNHSFVLVRASPVGFASFRILQ